ncbi:MAG: nucleotidyltransferase family protein [Magnetospirillum sp.]|nr:nucleotidyltransferase family protein [Magnetospirillum sp.]
MRDFRKALVSASLPIINAVAVINDSATQIAIVVDDNGILLGTVTDGDVRRGILNGVGLQDPVEKVMTVKATTGNVGDSRLTLMALMRQKSIAQVPILDAERRVVGLATLADLLKQDQLDNWVVLMAGGLGTRLHPLTQSLPKPLIPVGGKPILEWTITSLANQGFFRFFMSLNYKSQMFRDFFENGDRLNVQIDYLQEETQMGTAGALGLLPQRPTQPFIVMNGDVMATVDLREVLDFHNRTGADATVCVYEYSIQIPYAVAQLDGTRLTGLQEKPLQKFLINAGIYCLSPSFMDLLNAGERADMPDLLQALIDRGATVSAFPLKDYWRDIGRPEDLNQAESDMVARFN